jgi:hypothetical protein
MHCMNETRYIVTEFKRVRMDLILCCERFLLSCWCYCLCVQLLLGELRWEAQIKYLVNQSSDDGLCLFVYLLNSSEDLAVSSKLLYQSYFHVCMFLRTVCNIRLSFLTCLLK